MKKYLLTVLAFGALTTNVNADCTSRGCFNIDVTRLYVTNRGTIYIGTSGDEQKLNCISMGNVYMTLGRDDAGKDSMYSALLTAQATNKKVSVRVIENSSDCRVAYIVMD